jgi:hypothetical protein
MDEGPGVCTPTSERDVGESGKFSVSRMVGGMGTEASLPKGGRAGARVDEALVVKVGRGDKISLASAAFALDPLQPLVPLEVGEPGG